MLFIYVQILTYTNNVFELTLKRATTAVTSPDAETDVATKRTADEPLGALLLRGQMMLVDEWDMIVFLCTPVYNSFDIS